MGKKPLAALLLGGAAALIAGCSAAPVYSTPSLPSPASSAAGEGRAPEPAYTVTLSYVTQDKIHIHYPRISGLDDPALEQKINDLIAQDMWAKLVEGVAQHYADEPDILDKLLLDIDYQVTQQTGDILSIVYRGPGRIEDGMFATNTIETTTVDMRTGALMTLEDFVTIDEALVRRMKQAAVVWHPENADTDHERLMEFIRNQLDDSFIMQGLKEEQPYFSFYVTPDSLWISVPVSHAGGDYAVVQIAR